ncbi:MAG: HAD-IA family hydrolase, partial [Calditrichaeota bacterium]|nr:HAD-IA family hydrolase [Calditrichota bacterium]
KDEGLLDYFDVFVFSDEIGCSKPEERIFRAAFDQFDIEPQELVHLGDREHNDIKGAHRIGAHAILCIAAIDRRSNGTEAEAVFNNYRQLAEIIDTLNS